MAFQEDDPCLISQPLEISAILHGLLTERVLVRLDIPGQATSVISTLLESSPKTGTLLLDTASEDLLNTQLLRAPAARLQGMLNRVMIECTGPLSPAMHDSKPALSMPWPQQLRRIQRREFFRVDVPAGNPAHCLIKHHTLPNNQARFRIADISAGGLQLVDQDKLLYAIPLGTRYKDCTLELPDTGDLDVSLRVLRSTQLTQDNGKPQHQVACQFINLPANRQITIQQYIGALERAVLARRWGMD